MPYDFEKNETAFPAEEPQVYPGYPMCGGDPQLMPDQRTEPMQMPVLRRPAPQPDVAPRDIPAGQPGQAAPRQEYPGPRQEYPAPQRGFAAPQPKYEGYTSATPAVEPAPQEAPVYQPAAPQSTPRPVSQPEPAPKMERAKDISAPRQEPQEPVKAEPRSVEPVKETPVQQPPVQPPQPPVKAPALKNDEVLRHTASLWKYQPIPENEPDPAPEYIYATRKLPGGTVIGARVRGKKHKHEGTNCDDWYEVANYEKITCIAVSDGAGSKKFSRVGAKESCRAAIGYMISMLDRAFREKPELRTNLTLALSEPKCMEACGTLASIVQQAVVKAYEAVDAAFYCRAADPAYARVLNRALQFKDLSGTLLLAMTIPVSDTTKEHLVVSCQVGDGMIAILDSKGKFTGSVKLMGVPDSGEFSGETDFLTSPQMKQLDKLQNRTKIARCVVDTVMVMTDGVADDYFPNETQMRRLYFDLIANGILNRREQNLSLSTMTPAQIRLFKKIPDPLEFPWVNDQSVKVPIHYTRRICEVLGVELEDLWNDPAALELAQMELEETNKTADPSERLKIWLDNYVERGSFDDRTLVVLTM